MDFSMATLARGRSLLLLVAALFAYVPAAVAQSDTIAAPLPKPAPLATAAGETADALSKNAVHDVAVLDFVNVDSPQWNRVGQQLAAEFRSQLAALPDAPKQKDRSAIVERMLATQLSQYDLTFPGAAALVVRDSEFDSWIIAQLTPRGDFIDVKFSVFEVTNRSWRPSEIAKLSAQVSFTPELKAMLDPAPPDPLAAYPLAGTNGVGTPACVTCHQPDYTDAAVKAHIEGRVYLEIVVETSGDVGKIVVKRGAPLGLTEKAIASIQQWKLKPALDKAGQPVAVRQTAEVRFGLY
jgi:TonB family protein